MGMARGLLRLSPRPLLIHTTMVPTGTLVTMVWATEPTDTLDTPMPIMVMPTMDTTVMAPGPTMDWDTEDTDWDTEATTGDKFSAFEVQSRSSKRTSLLVI